MSSEYSEIFMLLKIQSEIAQDFFTSIHPLDETTRTGYTLKPADLGLKRYQLPKYWTNCITTCSAEIDLVQVKTFNNSAFFITNTLLEKTKSSKSRPKFTVFSCRPKP